MADGAHVQVHAKHAKPARAWSRTLCGQRRREAVPVTDDGAAVTCARCKHLLTHRVERTLVSGWDGHRWYWTGR